MQPVKVDLVGKPQLPLEVVEVVDELLEKGAEQLRVRVDSRTTLPFLFRGTISGALERAKRTGELNGQRGRCQEAALVEPREAGREQPIAKLLHAYRVGATANDGVLRENDCADPLRGRHTDILRPSPCGCESVTRVTRVSCFSLS